jgi:hypothetical protein
MPEQKPPLEELPSPAAIVDDMHARRAAMFRDVLALDRVVGAKLATLRRATRWMGAEGVRGGRAVAAVLALARTRGLPYLAAGLALLAGVRRLRR